MAWIPPEKNEHTSAAASGDSGHSRLRLGVALGGVVLTAILLVVLYFVLRNESSSVASFSERISVVEIRAENGSVKLTGSPTDVVAVNRNVNCFFRAPELTQQVEGDRLVIEQRCRFLSRCDVEYDVALPADVDVQIDTDNAGIEVRSVRGDLDLRSDNGAINVVESFGTLELHAGNENIRGEDISSLETNAETKNGSVEMRYETQPNRVDVTTEDGSITVRAPDSEAPHKVSATSNNGRSLVDVRTAPDAGREITVQSKNGDVTVVRP